eukprot:7973164-Karenia_brevis.AAC.1
MATRLLPVCPCHIKSHDDHPLNELADSVCALISKRKLHISLPAIPISLCNFDHAWPWMFIHTLNGQQLCQYHPVFQGSYACDTVAVDEWRILPPHVIADHFDKELPSPLEVTAAAVYARTLASFNTSKIKDDKARTAILQQFAEHNVLVVALQETGTTNAGSRVLGNFVVVSAPADEHGHGVELCFATD